MRPRLAGPPGPNRQPLGATPHLRVPERVCLQVTMTCTLACGATAAFTPAAAPKRADVRMESLADLKAVATKLNPAVGYWDPLKLAEVRVRPPSK